MSRDEIEVLTIGPVGVGLYPAKIGVSLAEAKSFNKFLGGSPTNLAVATAWYGHRSAVITRVGADGFGDVVGRKLLYPDDGDVAGAVVPAATLLRGGR